MECVRAWCVGAMATTLTALHRATPPCISSFSPPLPYRTAPCSNRLSLRVCLSSNRTFSARIPHSWFWGIGFRLLPSRHLKRSSAHLLSCCCQSGHIIKSNVHNALESHVARLMKEVRVGILLTVLIAVPANGLASGVAFGDEQSLLDSSEAGVNSDKLESPVFEAPSVCGSTFNHFTRSVFYAAPTSETGNPLIISSKDTCLNETAVLGSVENGGLQSECIEEVLSNVSPKAEAVEEVSNESVVQEAWQVVNENFLDARHHSWSADEWLKKKNEVLKRPLRSRMAAYGAIRGMLSSLHDPYTRFLTPDQFSQLAKYDVTGIGLNIGEMTTLNGEPSLKVFGLVLGSPAQLAGVRQGDEVLAVGGISVSGKTAFEAASLIQGPKGTPVSIEIRHGQCGISQTIEVVRQQDVRTPVYYRLELAHDSRQLMGYIHLKEFNALAKRDLVTAMKRLQDAGAASYVLDLRDNPGGLVQRGSQFLSHLVTTKPKNKNGVLNVVKSTRMAGIEIAKLFLAGGETVVETAVGRDPQTFHSILASGPPLTKAPLMVLVNDHTASASEIVAAALHDNCRALLVGKRTFGKGLIQAVYELSDGSGVVLTVGRYITPGHQDIDGAGIEPDYKQPPGSEEAQQKLGSCRLMKQTNNSSTSPGLALID